MVFLLLQPEVWQLSTLNSPLSTLNSQLSALRSPSPIHQAHLFLINPPGDTSAPPEENPSITTASPRQLSKEAVVPITPSPHHPITPSPHHPISLSPHLPVTPSPHLPPSANCPMSALRSPSPRLQVSKSPAVRSPLPISRLQASFHQL